MNRVPQVIRPLACAPCIARLRAPGMPAASGAAAGAAELVRRFARDSVLNPLDRVLAVPRAAEWTQRVEHIEHLAFTPRVSLSISAPVQRVMEGGERRIHTQSRLTETFRVDRVMERLSARVERIDTLRDAPLPRSAAPSPASRAMPAAPDRPVTPPPPAARSVERILRVATPGAAPASAPEVRQASEAATAIPPARATVPVPAESGARVQPFDVETLADRVVRVIDKRLTANRERLGRI